jgi:hypothetical protein
MLNWQAIDYNKKFEIADYGHLRFELVAKGNHHQLTVIDWRHNQILLAKDGFDYQKEARSYADGFLAGFEFHQRVI